VLVQSEITGLEGHDGMLEAVRWRQGAAGKEVRREMRHVFLFIGAEPNTIGSPAPAWRSMPRASY